MKIAIIGGGLAGCAAGYVLSEAGASVTLFEAREHIAGAASGNPFGLYNWRVAATQTPEALYYAQAFLATSAFFRKHDLGVQCGALHLAIDEKKSIRLQKAAQNWTHDTGVHLEYLSKERASERAGVSMGYDALFLPQAGFVSPVRVCEFYSKRIETKFGVAIDDVQGVVSKQDFDFAIVANAAAALGLDECQNLPLRGVRGQVTQIKSQEPLSSLKAVLCYGGYVLPQVEGEHLVGATFQRWREDSDIDPADDEQNIQGLQEIVAGLESPKVIAHRAAVRCTSPDHVPIVGRLPGSGRVLCSLAHGSHGIVSSYMAALVLKAMIYDEPLPLPDDVMQRIAPDRFF